ncbi:MAG: L-threonylcarbamoyladenylate synthase [bacterium]|nr:L-threonylcarbamoyladenylate synthase [bacterium]
METINKIVKEIKKGKVIVCPTDTVYGLIADATNKKAVNRLFKIKKRPKTKPIPIFVKDLKMARELAKINKKQEKFLKSAWPGKVTAVLERTLLRPSGFGGQGKTRIRLYGVAKETIALRIPKYELLLSLAKQLNRPLTGTSANISGKLASTKIKEVLQQFQNQKHQPDLIIDIGNLKPAKPSTIIDLTGSDPKILRK